MQFGLEAYRSPIISYPAMLHGGQLLARLTRQANQLISL